MSKVTVIGFQRSTYVNIVRLVLTHKQVPFSFLDLEEKIGGPEHLALHPFGRVPALRHDEFTLYETGAIVLYLEEVFPDRALLPRQARSRALVHQWISAVNAYYYPYLVYHLAHERLVFPALGIAPDEKVVSAALPRIEVALDVSEKALRAGDFLVDGQLSLADYFLYPSMFALNLTPEGQQMLPRWPATRAWLARMDALPQVIDLRAALPPPAPIEHARSWVDGHRPEY